MKKQHGSTMNKWRSMYSHINKVRVLLKEISPPHVITVYIQLMLFSYYIV